MCYCTACYIVCHSVGFCVTNVFTVSQMVDCRGKNIPPTCLSSKKENKAQAEQLQGRGGPSNDNMSAAAEWKMSVNSNSE